MIKNGLLGEAQADEAMKMWLCSFHEYDLDWAGEDLYFYLKSEGREEQDLKVA